MKSFKHFLTEARTAAGMEAEKKGLVHTGKGYYANAKGEIVAKAEGGKRLVPISPEEKAKLKQGVPLNTPPVAPGDQQAMAGQQMQSPQPVSQQQGQQAAEQPPAPEPGQPNPIAPQRNVGGPSVVVTFGRFNPPTIGHEKLLNKVAQEAQSSGADYKIYPSRSQDNKKNPLDFKTKHDMMKTMFPQHADMIVDDESNGKNIFDVLRDLHAQGYDNVKVVVGDDRVKEFSNMTTKYNGKNYNFGGLDTVSAGARDPDAEGVEGMSASKMRKAAAENDYESFKSGLPAHIDKDTAKELYLTVRRSMKLEEELWQIAPKLYPEILREEYFQGNIFNVGDIVENLNTGVVGEIVTRGSNYVIIIDEEKRIHRSWIKDITYHAKALEIGTDDYRKYVQRITPGESIRSFTKGKKKDK